VFSSLFLLFPKEYLPEVLDFVVSLKTKSMAKKNLRLAV